MKILRDSISGLISELSYIKISPTKDMCFSRLLADAYDMLGIVWLVASQF